MSVETAAHRRHMGGRIAATAADDARAAIDGKRRVCLHQFRRAGIVNVGAMPFRHAGVGLGDERGARPVHAHGEDCDQEIRGADPAIRPIGDGAGIEGFDERAESGRRDAHHRAASRVETCGDREWHAGLRRRQRRGADFFRGGHGFDPGDVRAALAQALDLLDEDVARFVLAQWSERGDEVAGRPDRSGDDHAPPGPVGHFASDLGDEATEFARAFAETMQRETPAIGAEAIGQDDVRPSLDKGSMQRLEPDRGVGVPKLGTVAGGQSHREQIGAGGAVRQQRPAFGQQGLQHVRSRG